MKLKWKWLKTDPVHFSSLIAANEYVGRKFILLAILCILTSPISGGEGTTALGKADAGMSLHGSFLNEKMPEGSAYVPLICSGNFRLPLIRRSSRHELSFHVMPQVNPVLIRAGGGSSTGSFEAGVNVGFSYDVRLAKEGFLYFGISSGPHFFEHHTSMQSRGFIFSDNFFLGWRQPVGNGKWLILSEVRYRHMSNANIKQPNAGIDNLLLGAGFSRSLGLFQK